MLNSKITNVELQKKTVETDGYEAVQVGFEDKRIKLSNKPAQGHVAKANTAPKRFIREFKNVEGLEVGAEITVETLAARDVVDVTPPFENAFKNLKMVPKLKKIPKLKMFLNLKVLSNLKMVLNF